MIRRFLIAFLTGMLLFVNTASAFAAASGDEPEAELEWILSYAVMGICIGMGLFVVIRSSRRDDSVISEYDRKREQEEEIKQAKGH